MMFTLVKILVSAFMIGGINVLARRSPVIGGWIAALPLISFLSVAWLAVDHAPASDINAFVGRVLLGYIPSALLLVILMAALSYGAPVPVAIACAGAAWLVLSVVARLLGFLG